MSYSSLSEALTRGKGTERKFRCHVHGDTTASASVNVVKGLWVCYACGAHGKVDETVVSYNERELLDDIAVLLSEPRGTYAESWLDQFDSGPVHPYWRSRFSEEACRHFRLGYDHGKGQPCYPLRDPSGAVLGLVYRNLDGTGPKYRYPAKVAIRQLLFNYDAEKRDTIILVEGAMDAIACWEVGYTAFAIYGSSLSREQIRLIQRVDPELVVLAFDADRAGEIAAVTAGNDLAECGLHTVRPGWDDGYKDVAEMPEKYRKEILDSVAL